MTSENGESNPSGSAEQASETRKVAISYARGLVGGMLIGVPVLMTMEVWWEGFAVPAWHILALYATNYGVLLILQHYSGLSHRKSFRAQASAALVAYGLGATASALILFALGVLRGDLNARDFAGKLILEAVPVSIGASVAMSEFGDAHRVAEQRRRQAGYWGKMAMAIAGASLFGFGISAAEEPLMIADQLDWTRAMLLMAISMTQVYAIVYAVDFKERADDVGTPQHRNAVIRESVSTYAVSLTIAAYFLWTFGTLDSAISLTAAAYATIVTGFVTSLGAAAGELLI